MSLHRWPIERHRSLDGLDEERLRALLCASFGRPALPEVFERAISRVYLEPHYLGVAFVADTTVGAYLSKFAVDPEAQGIGIGRALWDAVTDAQEKMFWRARSHNPINEWYSRVCDGLYRFDDWCIYWRRIPPSQLWPAIRYALAQPIDFPITAYGGKIAASHR